VISAKGYWESMLVTAHQATGSLLIAFSTWLICRVGRRQMSLATTPESFTIPSQVGAARPNRSESARILETVE